MFKLMGKEINAILGAQMILIWTYEKRLSRLPVLSFFTKKTCCGYSLGVSQCDGSNAYFNKYFHGKIRKIYTFR